MKVLLHDGDCIREIPICGTCLPDTIVRPAWIPREAHVDWKEGGAELGERTYHRSDRKADGMVVYYRESMVKT